jgi:hypothetical protein
LSFQQKSTLAMTGILVLVFGWYFTLVLTELASTPAADIAYQGVMIPAIVLLVALAALAHAMIATGAPADAGERDQRDRSVALRAKQAARYVLAVGTVAGLGLAVIEADTFWIAHVLLAGLVLAEITEGLTRLVLSRRGA